MAKCAICGRYMKDGTWNNHHLYFPKKKYKGTRRGRMTVQTHIQCHASFHYHFLHECFAANRRDCEKCLYTRICVYNTN